MTSVYRDILENATDLVFQVNAMGGVEYANPSFFESLGYSSKELKKVLIQDLIQAPANKTKEDWTDWLAGSSNELNFMHKKRFNIKDVGRRVNADE